MYTSIGLLRSPARRYAGYSLPTRIPTTRRPAAPLAERTGALQLGMRAPSGPHQDASFAPDRTPTHDERLLLGEIQLEAIHTPGHASNHYCYLLRAHGCLVTGDHIINGSTVVIDPPDGNMTEYLNALELLKRYPLSMLAPGHGGIIHTPFAAIDALIAHRQRREHKVFTPRSKRHPGRKR